MTTSPTRVLMLAFYFAPEIAGGTPRPLAFAKYLTGFGIAPIVLTREVPERASVDPSLLDELPGTVEVFRTGQASYKDYLRTLTRRFRPVERVFMRPQGWVADGLAWRLASWHPGIVLESEVVSAFVQRGQELIERFRPRLIWASGPPHGMLKAGAILAARNRLPLIADFRDPWTYGHEWSPRSRLQAWMERRWERRVLRVADRVVLTSPLTEHEFARRHPRAAHKLSTITNGFDGSVNTLTAARQRSDHLRIRFLGTLCRFRTPEPIVDAAEIIERKWPEIAERLSIQFIGHIIENTHEALARVGPPLIEGRAPVPFHDSSRLMVEADVLLLLQTIDGEGKDVISGKVYEYLAAGRQILGVVAPGGGDEWLLRQTGHTSIADFRDPAAIADSIRALWLQWSNGTLPTITPRTNVEQYHRRALTAQLHELIEVTLSTRPPVCTGATDAAAKPGN